MVLHLFSYLIFYVIHNVLCLRIFPQTREIILTCAFIVKLYGVDKALPHLCKNHFLEYNIPVERSFTPFSAVRCVFGGFMGIYSGHNGKNDIPEELTLSLDPVDDQAGDPADGPERDLVGDLFEDSPDNNAEEPQDDTPASVGSTASEPFEFIVEDETSDDVSEPELPEKDRKPVADKMLVAAQTGIGRFYLAHKTLFNIIFTVLLVLADFANSYGLVMLSGEFLPSLSAGLFGLLKLDTVDPSVWNPDLFLLILNIVISAIVGGFAFFFVPKTVALLTENLTGVISGLRLRILYPLVPVAFCLLFCFKNEYALPWVCSLSAAAGGVLYLILAKISLDIPVDSLKK